MKQTILLLTFLTTMALGALDHGIITGFGMGYNFMDEIASSRKETDPLLIQKFNDTFTISLSMGYRFGNLRLTGEYINTLTPITPLRFRPLQDKYTIDINYTFSNLKVGFSHQCSHPVITVFDTRNSFADTAARRVYLRFYKEY